MVLANCACCYQIRSDHNHGLYDQIIKTGLYQNSIMHATRYGPGVALGMHGKDRSLWSLLIVLVVIRRISFYNEIVKYCVNNFEFVKTFKTL